MLFVLLSGLYSMAIRTKAVKRATEVAELSLLALDKRNEMTKEQAYLLDRIATSVELMVKSESNT